MNRIAANILYLLGLVPWALIFLFSFMLFDAPGSESSPMTLGLFYSIASYPVLVAVGLLGSSRLLRFNGEHHWRRRLVFLPLLSPLFAVLFLVAIEVLCQGHLNCRIGA